MTRRPRLLLLAGTSAVVLASVAIAGFAVDTGAGPQRSRGNSNSAIVDGCFDTDPTPAPPLSPENTSDEENIIRFDDRDRPPVRICHPAGSGTIVVPPGWDVRWVTNMFPAVPGKGGRETETVVLTHLDTGYALAIEGETGDIQERLPKKVPTDLAEVVSQLKDDIRDGR